MRDFYSSRENIVPQDGIFRPLDPYAGDGRVCTPRLSVFTLSSASVRRGDHITQISPSHAHAPPPSPRGGKPTVRAARACVRCDDARRVGYAPLRPSRSIHVLYSARRGGKTDAVQQNMPFTDGATVCNGQAKRERPFSQRRRRLASLGCAAVPLRAAVSVRAARCSRPRVDVPHLCA